MKTHSTPCGHVLHRFFYTRKVAWQAYWTQERKAEMTVIIGSFLLSGLLFWCALRTL